MLSLLKSTLATLLPCTIDVISKDFGIHGRYLKLESGQFWTKAKTRDSPSIFFLCRDSMSEY